MRIQILTAAALLALASQGHAKTDHAAVVAAMKSEQQQCRYYLQRCEAGDIDGMSAVAHTMKAIHGRLPSCQKACDAAVRKLLGKPS